MTTLLLDVGNSRLKWGVLVSDAIHDTGYISLRDLQQQGAATLTTQLPQQPEATIACNVAGEGIAGLLDDFVHSTFGNRIHFVKSSAAACGVTNAYPNPGRLGVDRWVAMIGARAASTAACLVVDAGTAITLDAMDEHGQHLGGQILPGFKLMADALGRNTSDLPGIDPNHWTQTLLKCALATSTDAAIAQGLLTAVLGAVERNLRLVREFSSESVVILTGGDAEIIHRHLRHAKELRPHLVLEGLARLAQGSLGSTTT